MKAKNRIASHSTAHRAHPNGPGPTNGRTKSQAEDHPIPNAKSTTKKPKVRARKPAPKRKARPAPLRRPSVAERFAKAMGYLHAVRSLAEKYVLDRAESVKQRSREAVHVAVNRLVGGTVLLSVLVMVVVLTIRGIAGAFAEAFGGRVWAGDLATAGLLVVGIGIGWATLQLFQETPPRRRSPAARSPEPLPYSSP